MTSDVQDPPTCLRQWVRTASSLARQRVEPREQQKGGPPNRGSRSGARGIGTSDDNNPGGRGGEGFANCDTAVVTGVAPPDNQRVFFLG